MQEQLDKLVSNSIITRRVNQWRALKSISDSDDAPPPVYGATLTPVGVDRLLLFGGNDGSSRVNSIFSFDIGTHLS